MVRHSGILPLLSTWVSILVARQFLNEKRRGKPSSRPELFRTLWIPLDVLLARSIPNRLVRARKGISKDDMLLALLPDDMKRFLSRWGWSSNSAGWVVRRAASSCHQSFCVCPNLVAGSLLCNAIWQWGWKGGRCCPSTWVIRDYM